MSFSFYDDYNKMASLIEKTKKDAEAKRANHTVVTIFGLLILGVPLVIGASAFSLKAGLYIAKVLTGN